MGYALLTYRVLASIFFLGHLLGTKACQHLWINVVWSHQADWLLWGEIINQGNNMYGVESLPRYMEGFSPPCKEINAYKRNQLDVFVTDQVRKVGWGRDQNLPKNDIKLHHPGKRLLENSSGLHPVWGTMEKCKLQIARRKLALDGWRNPWGRSQSWKIAANYQMFDIPSTGRQHRFAGASHCNW